MPNGWYAFEREMLPPRPVDETASPALQANAQAEDQQESHSGNIAAPITAASRLLAAGQLHTPPTSEEDLPHEVSSQPSDAARTPLPRSAGASTATIALSQLIVALSEHLRAPSFDGTSDDGGGRAVLMRKGPSVLSIPLLACAFVRVLGVEGYERLCAFEWVGVQTTRSLISPLATMPHPSASVLIEILPLP